LTLLLDTHAVVWWLASDRRLGEAARAAIGSSATQSWVSVASVWEAAIKSAAGRLRLPKPPDVLLSDAALHEAGFQTMEIRATHALIAAALPRFHADPFDRMLIAQGQAEDLTIVTSDVAFDAYDVRVLDARA
jgi:PIN domain nuclease of toxin-antitoxin system